MGKSTINGPFSLAFCMFTRGYQLAHGVSVNWWLNRGTWWSTHLASRTWFLPEHKMENLFWLVVYLPLWKIWVRQLGLWHSQLNGKNHVPNHQPVLLFICGSKPGTSHIQIAGGGSSPQIKQKRRFWADPYPCLLWSLPSLHHYYCCV